MLVIISMLSGTLGKFIYLLMGRAMCHMKNKLQSWVLPLLHHFFARYPSTLALFIAGDFPTHALSFNNQR